MACTTILVGKNASYDGSTLVARNEDSGSGEFCSKRFTVVMPDEQPHHYKSVISHVEVELPDNPMRYTNMPNAILNEGIWGAVGVNEENISMSATETITSNERVLGADPLVVLIPEKGKNGDSDYVPETPGGLGEEDFVTLILPYIHSARDGVIRLGHLLEEYGTYEMNGIAFQDVNEIWWFETIGGHHWIAKRVPDDAYVTMPNQFGIDEFDLDDAFSAKKEHMCSDDLKEFIKKYHLNLSMDSVFNPRYAFGSHADSDHVYNTPRAWAMQRFLNPYDSIWDGIDADYTPASDNIPWCRTPERKITIEDVKYVLSNHFQGTPYDPYAKYGDEKLRGSFRPIGVNRNCQLACVQIRPYMPKSCQVIEWIAFGSNVFNAFVPFYTTIEKTPKYVEYTPENVTTESFYWANRLIAALSDAHYHENGSHIERYQLSVQSKGHELINKFDKEFENITDIKDIISLSERANEEISDMLKTETDKALGNVLYESSLLMKNGFSRSDA